MDRTAKATTNIIRFIQYAVRWQPNYLQERGEYIGYQGRKAANICNSLFLADNQGLMLACSCPVAGQHHNLFQIKQVFEELCDLLQEAGIETKGLFLNADAGFDSQELRQQYSDMKIEANIAFNPRKGETAQEYVYFDEEFFHRRKVIEQAKLGSTASKLYSFSLKLKPNIGWLSTS